jgi:hypothetical protein
LFDRTSGEKWNWYGRGEPPANDPQAIDIGGVATHEFGHGLGLEHHQNTQSTMFGTILGNGLGLRTLHEVDVNCAESLYGLRTTTRPGVTITQAEPDSGLTAGGDTVVVSGTNFTWDSDTAVFIGIFELQPEFWSVEDCHTLRINAMPPRNAGKVDLTIVNSLGSAVLEDAYEYKELVAEVASIEPTSGPTAGGIDLFVSGRGFIGDIRVEIDGQALTDQELLSDRMIRGRIPRVDASRVVDVTVRQGQSFVTLSNAFTYEFYGMRVGSGEGPVGGTESIDIPVHITSPRPLRTVQLALRFPSDALKVDEVISATELSPTTTLDPPLIDNNNGLVSVRLSTVPTFPLEPSVDLPIVMLRLRALRNATAGEDFSLALLDGEDVVNLFTRDEDNLRFRPETDDGSFRTSSAVFRRGDANNDTRFDLADALYVLNFVFRGGRASPCADAADANDDGGINLADPLWLLNWKFRGGPDMPEPFAEFGPDPTPDDLDCFSGM